MIKSKLLLYHTPYFAIVSSAAMTVKVKSYHKRYILNSTPRCEAMGGGVH